MWRAGRACIHQLSESWRQTGSQDATGLKVLEARSKIYTVSWAGPQALVQGQRLVRGSPGLLQLHFTLHLQISGSKIHPGSWTHMGVHCSPVRLWFPRTPEVLGLSSHKP